MSGIRVPLVASNLSPHERRLADQIAKESLEYCKRYGRGFYPPTNKDFPKEEGVFSRLLDLLKMFKW